MKGSDLPSPKPERIDARAAALITGRSVRAVQDMAARGQIPGAAKIGRAWTFDEMTLRDWIRQLEAEVAARREARVPESIDAEYDRLIGRRSDRRPRG